MYCIDRLANDVSQLDLPFRKIAWAFNDFMPYGEMAVGFVVQSWNARANFGVACQVIRGEQLT